MKSNDLYVLLQQTSSKFNGDDEHDSYLILNLISKLGIEINDDHYSHYSHLYKYFLELIDYLIDKNPIDEEYFSEEISDVIDNIETIQLKLESFASKQFDEQHFLYNTPNIMI